MTAMESIDNKNFSAQLKSYGVKKNLWCKKKSHCCVCGPALTDVIYTYVLWGAWL